VCPLHVGVVAYAPHHCNVIITVEVKRISLAIIFLCFYFLVQYHPAPDTSKNNYRIYVLELILDISSEFLVA